MNCNFEIHDDSIKINEVFCPFCYEKLQTHTYRQSTDHCCKNMNLETIDGQVTSTNCGQQNSEEFKTNYIDFYENMFKIRKKSIYIRKYHIQNVLSDIELKNKLPISRAIINRVCQTSD